MPTSDEIIIVGAGIGGLAAALSLHEAGFAVRVFESVPEIKPLGVGINMLPHAVRELEELGLRAPIEQAGVACRELAYFTKRGERIWGEPRGLAAGYRWPQISIHRGTLQILLLEAAKQRLGSDRLHLAASLRASKPSPAVASARDFWTARPAAERHGGRPPAHRLRRHPFRRAADILSRRRAAALEWRGHVARRRGIRPRAGRYTMIMAGHPRTKFVCYPISHAASRPGAQQINFVAERRFDTTALDEARGLESRRAAGGFSAGLRALSLRLAGRPGADSRGTRGLGLSDG